MYFNVSHMQCRHCYCGDCYVAALRESAASDRPYVRQTPSSLTIPPSSQQHKPGCKAELGLLRNFTTLAHILQNKPSAFREPGRDANGVLPSRDAKENGSFIASATASTCRLIPSSKLTAVMAVIGTWQQDHPTDKIIGMTFLHFKADA